MTSSSSFWYRSMSKFELPLSFVQSSWNLAQGSILRRWSRTWTKKADRNTLWARKRQFSTKSWKFRLSTSWQKCCHGNTLGYCQINTVSNDALYNYTKSQKVSSAYCKPFWHYKAKIYGLMIGLMIEILKLVEKCKIYQPCSGLYRFFIAVLKRFSVGWWNFLTFIIII